MKNKFIFYKIFLLISLLLAMSVLIFIILGNISRKGYLSDFKLNENLSSHGNYSYSFRIKYYSKVFRNSDIYGVYTDTNKIIENHNFIKEIKFEKEGSPFGILNSVKELQYDEKADNIDYKLKIKLPILLIVLIICLFSISIFILTDENKRRLSLEYLDKIKFFCIKYKKHIIVLYLIIIIVFILFVIINSNINHTSKITDLELIAESKAGYVYKGKIDLKYNFLFSIDNNSIQFNDTNDIKYYGYSLFITNKPLVSWYSTNIYYTDNNTFIISNESTNQNAYYYGGIQVPTYIGDKYKITILAKRLAETGNISWHLNSLNNFKEITKKEISNNYTILTDTREITSQAGGILDLHLMIPKGITEIESILIESLNKLLNIDNSYTVFTSIKKIDTAKVQYRIKLENTSKYLIVILIFIYLFIFCITYKKNIQLLLHSKRFKKYIFISYSIITIIFILFVIINSNIKYTLKLRDLELIAESKAGYVYKSKLDFNENFLYSINKNSLQFNNTNNIKYYGYSLFITNKPSGSWYSTNIYYTDNNTFIISNESTNEKNAYYYGGIQVPTYIGDKYKITILAKQLPETGNISWHLNGHNNFKEITKKEISNNYTILTDTREVPLAAANSLDLHFMIPHGVTEIESILIESENNKLNFENGYTIFTTKNKLFNNSILLSGKLYLYNICRYILSLYLVLIVILFNIYVNRKDIKNICNICFIIVLILLKNIYIVADPQFWAEDGLVFFEPYLNGGWKYIFNSYAGYYLFIPKLLTIISFKLSIILTNNITLIPLFMNTFAVIFAVLCISYLFYSDECNFIPDYNLKLFLSFLIAAIPFSIEIFISITNLHWFIGYFIFLVSMNIIYNNKLPNYFTSFLILLSSLSSVYGILISISIFIYLLNNFLKHKNIFNLITKNIIKLFVLNIGIIIQLYSILNSGRVDSHKEGSIIIHIIYFICILIKKLFVTELKINEIVFIVFGFVFLFLIILNIIKNKDIIGFIILLFMLFSVFFYASGNNINMANLILTDNSIGSRYLFLPGSILLTLLIYNLKYINSKFNYFYKLLLFLILINFFVNINNLQIIRNRGWNELSKFYNKNGKYTLFININPIGWGVNIPSDIDNKGE
ncbi:hypothetical protein R4I97_08510 [Brachyspira pilosicoli]|uniref:hypothetical protein n=1 Tax=Brachyspira pilosicoli TaxID=52584 RepID=UPI0030043717